MSLEPLIVSPTEHPITLDMIDDEALLVLRKLNRAGFSSYLVGGGVRDLYIGKTPKDFDISTDARPGQVRRLFPNSRTIGRRFRLVQVFFRNNKVIEVSTLRSLSEHDLDGPEAVLAPNNTYGSLDEDAQRRDITINALFYETVNQTIIDYVGGVDDLDRCIIRIVGDPDKRINRDPVRMMRVIRHSARNHFHIEPDSWQSVCANSHKITLCPPSRLRDELLKDLYSGNSSRWYELACNSRLFYELFDIYRNSTATKVSSTQTCGEQLSAIFHTIDRLNTLAVEAGYHRQPDFFLLAFILIPWAAIEFDLFTRKMKGHQIFHLAKQIRERLNDTIGLRLNLKRSTRQEITTLLTHLPTLVRYRQSETWPKWLKRKSYFSKCRLLYFYYREASEGNPVPSDFCSPKHASPQNPDRGKRPNKGNKRTGRPAFSANRRGGVFGFKR